MESLKLLTPYFRDKKWSILIGSLTSLIKGVLAIYLSYLTKELTDLVIIKEIESFNSLLKLGILAIVATVICTFLSQYLTAYLKNNITLKLRNDCVKQVMNLSYKQKQTTKQGI